MQQPSITSEWQRFHSFFFSFKFFLFLFWSFKHLQRRWWRDDLLCFRLLLFSRLPRGAGPKDFNVYRAWLLNCYFRFLGNNSDKVTSRTCTTAFRFQPAIIKREVPPYYVLPPIRLGSRNADSSAERAVPSGESPAAFGAVRPRRDKRQAWLRSLNDALTGARSW